MVAKFASDTLVVDVRRQPRRAVPQSQTAGMGVNQAAAVSGTAPVAAPPVAIPIPSDAAASAERPRKLWREILETSILTIAVFALARMSVQSYRIAGTSMEPNFTEREFVIVNKLAYLTREPRRGDVIVFQHPDAGTGDLIKRVIGVPGDTVEIRKGRVYINGLPTTEPWPLIEHEYDAGPVLVGVDKLFVLGDNRADSRDSHVWGLLDRETLIGQAWLTVWPFGESGMIRHEQPAIQLTVPSS